VLGLEAFFIRLPPDIRAVVLTGEGEHFSAGLDLSEVAGTRDPLDAALHSRMWHRAFEAIEFGRAPVIAALHGAVVGGGFELAAAAHIRVAERSTYYGLPEGQRGIFLGGGGSVRIARLIGVPRVMDMMLTGRTLSAEEGQAAGATQYLVEDGKGLETAMALAAKAASNTATTNFAVLHALPRIADSDPASRVADGGDGGNERRGQGAAQGLPREARRQGHAPELTRASKGGASASPAGDQPQPRARMEGAHHEVHRDHSAHDRAMGRHRAERVHAAAQTRTRQRHRREGRRSRKA
jgi:enoyl-CoA hydratase/carnithine racemase